MQILLRGTHELLSTVLDRLSGVVSQLVELIQKVISVALVLLLDPVDGLASLDREGPALSTNPKEVLLQLKPLCAEEGKLNVDRLRVISHFVRLCGKVGYSGLCVLQFGEDRSLGRLVTKLLAAGAEVWRAIQSEF